MKLLRATAIVVLLFGSAMPVAGQEPATVPLFSRAAIRRAVASARKFGPPLPALGQAQEDGSNVRRLAAGTEVVVTAVNTVSGPYEVLDSDDASLTVLNVAGMAASGHGPELRRWATRDPHALASVAQGGTIITGDLRIAPEGVFAAGRKIGDLRQFLVRVPKADVREISRVSGRTGSRTAAGADPSDLGPMLLGLLGGGIVGGYFGQRAAAGPRARDALIYQVLPPPHRESTPASVKAQRCRSGCPDAAGDRVAPTGVNRSPSYVP